MKTVKQVRAEWEEALGGDLYGSPYIQINASQDGPMPGDILIDGHVTLEALEAIVRIWRAAL